jgi:dihydrofolate synthase/folylpolyglutamate synthase
MEQINPTKQSQKERVVPGKQRSYSEIIDFLDSHWQTNLGDKTFSCIKKLDQAFGSLSQKLNTILISGTNGKSLTAHFATKLFLQEGLTVGTFLSPHLLTYNERFAVGNETINNKIFAEIANEVINMAETLNVTPNTLDILTTMALLHFERTKVDVALIEIEEPSTFHPATICSPKIAAITRVTEENAAAQAEEAVIRRALVIVKKGTHTVSADQSKLNLQVMQSITQELGGTWAMPIRKLAPLNYPFEQLHGRCAALAERIAYIYINEILKRETIFDTNSSLLTKRKGQRGRPTIEAKRESELNPRKTVEQFWKETLNTLPGHFQLLDKEKPSVLLDNASNLDAFKNLLLGIRLLHYQRPLKGLTLVLGCDNPDLAVADFLKLLRYFFKKTSGQVIVCPTKKTTGGQASTSWNVEAVTNDIKSMKIKARSAQSFTEAFDAAVKTVDERHGLVVITGSSAIISEYWRDRGLKKL